MNDFSFPKHEFREQVKAFIHSKCLKYHVTITFPKNTPESQTMDLLNLFIGEINSRTYGKKYLRGESHLTGFAIREWEEEMWTPHFHILIAGGDEIEDARFRRIVHKGWQFTKKLYQKGKFRDYIADYKVQNYYEDKEFPKRLEDYLTKQFRFRSWQVAWDSVGILGAGDVAFGTNRFGEQRATGY